MAKWAEFEIQCFEYLNKEFGQFAKFTYEGGASSTTSDILVHTKGGNKFYFEVKMSPAQCGQFVLLPNTSTFSFTYSCRNINEINQYSKQIINHMNEFFEEFCNAGTEGYPIEMKNGPSIFAKWIIQAYEDKNIKFIITNRFIIFPIEEIQKYFKITATYREKRSGSGDVGVSRINSLKKYLTSTYTCIDGFRVEGSKLFLFSKTNLENQKFSYDSNKYMFSLRNAEYEIRKLSKTSNANVIFSVALKHDVDHGMSKNDVINALR